MFRFLSPVSVVDVFLDDHGSAIITMPVRAVVMPMPVRSVVPVAPFVVVPFPSCPAVMMSVVRLVAPMVALVIMVSLAVSAMICPNVAAQCQKSNQNDSDKYELPCHVDLLCVGFSSDPLSLFSTRKTGVLTEWSTLRCGITDPALLSLSAGYHHQQKKGHADHVQPVCRDRT